MNDTTVRPRRAHPNAANASAWCARVCNPIFDPETAMPIGPRSTEIEPTFAVGDAELRLYRAAVVDDVDDPFTANRREWTIARLVSAGHHAASTQLHHVATSEVANPRSGSIPFNHSTIRFQLANPLGRQQLSRLTTTQADVNLPLALLHVFALICACIHRRSRCCRCRKRNVICRKARWTC